MNRLTTESLRAVVWWRPIRRRDEFCFAEALRQALAAGMEINAALLAAGTVNPNLRLRTALTEAARHVRHGHTLEQALIKTGVNLRRSLLGALRVGEERGCVGRMLGVMARAYHPQPARKLADVLRRPMVIRRLADALAELLRDHPMTHHILEDAVFVAAGTKLRPHGVLQTVLNDVQNGASLGDAIARHPWWFDTLFCQLVEATDERVTLREVLRRLAGRDEPTEANHDP